MIPFPSFMLGIAPTWTTQTQTHNKNITQ